MTNRQTHIDDSIAPEPPVDLTASGPQEPEVYEWALNRFTASNWSAEGIELRVTEGESSHVALSGTLSSSDGSLVQILPFDPEEHLHDGTVYSAHRVRLRDDLADETHYASTNIASTTDIEVQRPVILALADADQGGHPYSKANNIINFHSQELIHRSDKRYNSEDNPTPASAQMYTIDTIEDVILGCFAATQKAAQSTTQPSLGAF